MFFRSFGDSLTTSENPLVRFPFLVITVFWDSTSYTVINVLWKMLKEPVDATARWWHCACLKCVSGLEKLEKTLNFLRCVYVIDLVLKYGSDINEGNWLQLLSFLCFDEYKCFRYWNAFFRAVFQVLDWSFLGLHFDGNVCSWNPKWIWPRMDWFWDFCWKMASFVDFIFV